MRATRLDGRAVAWTPRSAPRADASGLHRRCRSLLPALFPGHTFLEEVALPGSRLRADFFCPALLLLVEVQGSQHSQFSFFHHRAPTLALAFGRFRRAQANDEAKVELCRLNRWSHVALPHDDDDEGWAARLRAHGPPG